MTSSEYDYDLIVIGGGSGGMACSKEAVKYGAKILVFDYPKPSPQGSSWGLGGTCVNVGCMPKILMHHAAEAKQALSDAESYGITNVDPKAAQLDWGRLITGVQGNVGQSNFGYRNQLRKRDIDFKRAYALLKDPHTVEYEKDGAMETVTAKYIVIAGGGRPTYPDIPGAREHCITSDDIFSLKKAPGKTLCVGASYISLECAGFLTELGYDTTVMVRSILLRGFDQEAANMIGAYMENHGTKFIKEAVPTSFTKNSEGKIVVKYKKTDETAEHEEVFDTVLLAVGRTADTSGLKLDRAGVKVNPKTHRIPTTNDATNVPNIFCIGDMQEGATQLTPTAIQCGQKLARRLFANGTEQMSYEFVPTTVFTPLEYGMIGMSEEDAIAKFGKDKLHVYCGNFVPLIRSFSQARDNDLEKGFVKLVCVADQKDRVVGFHYLGPNAADVIGGWAAAMRLGLTKYDIDETVGVHPSNAEEVNRVWWKKGDPEPEEEYACCG
ncbi:thioredoxin reductase [Blattamonas nauphoetae]|uniref:thioredoxin-disulfide reductase (NADPH) n=1 Tax=Blattamonas nauphoetae TaxID=2049346 RepID=A0ABQ9X140_9EUKA|nr:thioredoxin reductase [Blattamonas nauphoetae]